MRRALLAGVLLGAVFLSGCSTGEEEPSAVPFPTVTSTGLPPPPDENIVPEQENGIPLPVPEDTASEAPADQPPVSATPTPIIVTPPPPIQLPTAQGDAQAAVSVLVSNLIDFARRDPQSTVTIGMGVLNYATSDGESLSVALPEGVIVMVGKGEMAAPVDAVFIEGNYCVSIPNPDSSKEYFVLKGSITAQPLVLPVVEGKSC